MGCVSTREVPMLVRRLPCVQTVVLTAVIAADAGVATPMTAAVHTLLLQRCSSNRCSGQGRSSCHTGWLQRLLASVSDSTVSFAASQVPVKRREPHPKFCMAALQQIMLPEALGFRPCDGSHD